MMAEGDKDQKDELFEDLDKFFAPIQDVEWPEPEEPSTTPSPSAQSGDEPPVAEERQEATDSRSQPEAAAQAPASTGDEAGETEEGIADREAIAAHDTMELEGVVVRPASASPGEGELFGGEPGSVVDDWPTDPEDESMSPLLSEEADEIEIIEDTDTDTGTDTDTENMAEDEPGRAEAAQGEDEIAEASPSDAPTPSISIDATEGEPPAIPSIDAVEEAAEHFAASVRAGTGFDDSGGAPGSQPPEHEDPATRSQAEIQTEADLTFDAESDVEESILADLEEPVTQRTVVVGSEGVSGPSWQEPTSVEVGGEPDGRIAPRDVPAAFLTGAVLAAIALGSLAIDRGVFAVVASILVVIAMGEIYGVLHKRHLQPATAIGLVTGALVLAGAYFHGEQAMLAMVALGTVSSFIWFMTVPAAHRKNIAVSIALTMLPVVYAALLAGYALITVTLPESFDGPALVLAVIGLTFVYDTAAFAIGSVWGSRPFAQAISPKKSWEGAIGATLVVIIVAIGLVAAVVEPLESIGTSLGLAVVVAIFAPLGDLAESLLKRDLDVKDMGSILPGHGGVLDRIDSLLFVAPAAFLYFRIFL
jgi:phosphatidate cytidylyltransferase